MKNILISGGSSYLGQNLINLLAKNNKVSIYSRDKKNFFIINKNLKFTLITNKKELFDKLNNEKFDIYINLISDSKKIKNLSGLINSLQANYFLNKQIVNRMIKSSNVRIIQINSYWQLLKTKNRKKFSIYVWGKNKITKYLEMAQKNDVLDLCILYLGDVYGEKDYRNKLIPSLLKNLNLKINNRSGLFFPTYIKDVSKAVEAIILNNLDSGKYYLFDEYLYVKDVVEIMSKLPQIHQELPKKEIDKFLNLQSLNLVKFNKVSFSENISKIF